MGADGRDVVCGPLLNYRHMNRGDWFGSVLIVVKGGGGQVLHRPSLPLRRHGQGMRFEPERQCSDPRNTFWSFCIDVPIGPDEVEYECSIPDVRIASPHKPPANSFFVPAASESMRVFFYSCNGFSVGTDKQAINGACLWHDVLRKHEERPFRVMIGGGDQIYNDGIRVNGPLRAWTDVGNPVKRRDFPFPTTLRAECDDSYLGNYIRWFNKEPFAWANGQIPQVNIWDDHDVR